MHRINLHISQLIEISLYMNMALKQLDLRLFANKIYDLK